MEDFLNSKNAVLIENTSKVYINGSIWDSNSCGKFKIIGKVEFCNPSKIYKSKPQKYLCEFISDGTKIITGASSIKTSFVKNPNHKIKHKEFNPPVIETIDDFKIIKNTSKVYYNGSIWKSNHCGEFEILGKSNKYKLNKKNKKEYKYFVCKFEDGYKTISEMRAIKRGTIKNPYYPSVFNEGFLGEGKWKSNKNNRSTKEYDLWIDMLKRCYNEKIRHKYPSYKDVIVSENWKNFQNFCNDLQKLHNYKKWKSNNDSINFYELDKDIICTKLNIYPKIYSLETCMFITKKENNPYNVKNILYDAQSEVVGALKNCLTK